MKREVSFTKRVLGGVDRYADIKNAIEMWLVTIGPGDWTIKLEKKTKPRGLSQNALLWVWMDVMSKEWADATDDHYTKEQWKEFFARKFLPVTGPCGEIVGGVQVH